MKKIIFIIIFLLYGYVYCIAQFGYQEKSKYYKICYTIVSGVDTISSECVRINYQSPNKQWVKAVISKDYKHFKFVQAYCIELQRSEYLLLKKKESLL